jgi:hypothetical protein
MTDHLRLLRAEVSIEGPLVRCRAAIRAEAAEVVAMIGEPVPITEEMADAGGQLGLGLAPVEHGDFVVAVDQPPHQGRADEARAADDEDAHELSPPLSGDRSRQGDITRP